MSILSHILLKKHSFSLLILSSGTSENAGDGGCVQHFNSEAQNPCPHIAR